MTVLPQHGATTFSRTLFFFACDASLGGSLSTFRRCASLGGTFLTMSLYVSADVSFDAAVSIFRKHQRKTEGNALGFQDGA